MKNELFTRYPQLKCCEKDIDAALDLIRNTYISGGTVYVCGNGGSCSDSDHIVGELMKGFLKRRPVTTEEKEKFKELFGDESFADKLQSAIPAVSLTAQSAIISAFAKP